MLARSVRLAQLLELAAWLAVGAALAHAGRLPGWTIALAPAVGMPALRLALVCASFALGWFYRTPRAAGERIGPARTVAMVLAEWRALLAFNLLYLPWERRFLRPDPQPAAGRVAVVLVHGYFANRGYFVPLVRLLEREQGVRVSAVPSFRAFFATIDHFAEELHRAVEETLAATGAQRVALVGHSMGGLACRAYLAAHGPGRVAALVTIGTPHHGTALARFGMGANARQMERGCAFLERLAAAEADAPRGIPAVSIYSPHDNMVAPQATSRLPWATNIALPGHGHLELGACAPVARLVAEALAQAGVERAP